jgi:hypothetical protein
VPVRIDPAAPPAWSRSGEMTVLVRSPAGKRRVIRALNAGSERLFSALLEPGDEWQPVKGVERARAAPEGVQLRVHASDLGENEARTLAGAIAGMLTDGGVSDALVTLPAEAPRTPAPAPVAAAANAYAEEAWARAAALLEPPPGARQLTVLDPAGASSLTASYALEGDADAALEPFTAAVRTHGCVLEVTEDSPLQPGVTRMRTLTFGGALRGTATVIESSWPPPWGPVVATVTIER